MTEPPRDTIFALSTARGRAAVAILRISGPQADAALAALAGPLPEPRRATLRTLRRPQDSEPLDQALILRFEASASFTGEKAVELQCHGSPAVVSALLDALGALPGLRLAEPGEFTRRALENGRLDLIEAEALADLVNAETEAQRRQALHAMRGALGDAASAWRAGLIRARALVEAVMDFADEEVPENVAPEVIALTSGVISGIEAALAGASAAERIRDGFEVALIGPPNAGKSTLLNALARREAALTSEIAGTTRDVIEVHLDLAGLPVTLLDTAGLRDATDRLEAMGIERARARAAQADLRIYLQPPDASEVALDVLDPQDIVVFSKSDLRDLAPAAQKSRMAALRVQISISATTGEGLSLLVQTIAARLSTRAAGATAVTRLRHRTALETSLPHLFEAVARLEAGDSDLDLAAEELRLGVHALESLLGRVDAERILDDIFSEFCIGK